MVFVWDQVKNSLGTLIGSNDVAGFILGGVLMLGILAAVMIAASGSRISGEGLFYFSMGIGLVLAVGFAWFPLWTLIVISLFVALVVIQPFGNRSGA